MKVRIAGLFGRLAVSLAAPPDVPLYPAYFSMLSPRTGRYSAGLACGLNFETHSDIVCAGVFSNRAVARNNKRTLHLLKTQL